MRIHYLQHPVFASCQYGEIKIVKTTGEYHAIPRTSPRRTS